MLKRVLTFLAACAGIALLTVAVFMLLFGIFALRGNDVSDATRSALIGVATIVVLTALPGLALYRHAGRSLRGRSRATMHVALLVCVAGSAGFVSWLFGAFDRSNVVLADGVLVIEGKLDLELLESFKRVMATEPLDIRRVRLRSPGGDVYAGMAIGREIHRRGLDIEVDKRCYSSCANYLFTAGNRKYLESADLVRFHGGALQPNFVDEARDLLRTGMQMDTPLEVSNPAHRRELYGLRDDFPFNSASFILAEREFFAEIGVSQLIPVSGQYGDYGPWFNDGVHDSYYYSPDDYAVLGVANVDVKSSTEASRGKLFRARTTAASAAAVQAELGSLFDALESAFPFDETGIWR